MTANGSITRNRLSYQEARKVEDLLREAWKYGKYIEKASDGSVAQLASQQLKRVVSAFNVRGIRQALGWVSTKPTIRLSKAEILRIEEALSLHGNAVVVKRSQEGRERLAYVYEVDRYFRLRKGMAKTRKHLVKVDAA